MTERTQCRSCGAPIFWVRMAKTQKLNPLNAEPDERRGNVYLNEAGDGEVRASAPLFSDGPGYLSHFATCANADEWREKKR